MEKDKHEERVRLLEVKIDTVAENWRRLSSEGDSGRANALKNELGLLAWQWFEIKKKDYKEKDKDNLDDFFQEAFLLTFQKYDPEKGSFSRYMTFLLSKRRKDQYRETPCESLDAPIDSGDDNSDTLGEMTADDKTCAPDNRVMLEASYLDLVEMVLNFTQRHPGRSGNEKRRTWYRIFYTEDMTRTYKELDVHFDHERDIFTAMLLPYLDYYMALPCRTGRQIAETPLKYYRDVVPERKAETGRVPVPIPGDVSVSYLRSIGEEASASARSNIYPIYRQEVRLLNQEDPRC